MSTIIQGNSSNVTTPLLATVTSTASNGSGGTRVATSAPHLYGTGDWVWFGGTTIIPRSTFYQITVIDATHFDIALAFTSTDTGTANDQSITPYPQVTSDGDPTAMQASLLSAIQCCLDRTQYLAKLMSQLPSGWLQYSSGIVEYVSARIQGDANSSETWNGSWLWGGSSDVQADAGSTTTFLSGSSVTFNVGSSLAVDGTFTVPAYNSIECTIASRTVSQPLVPLSINSNCTVAASASLGSYLLTVGNTGGGAYVNVFALTKMIAGATLTSIGVDYNVTVSAHAPATPSTVTLYAVSVLGAVTVIGTANGPSNITGVGTVAISGLTHVVSDGLSYYVQITGEAGTLANNVEFYPPAVFFSDITFVGQF